MERDDGRCEVSGSLLGVSAILRLAENGKLSAFLLIGDRSSLERTANIMRRHFWKKKEKCIDAVVSSSNNVLYMSLSLLSLLC